MDEAVSIIAAMAGKVDGRKKVTGMTSNLSICLKILPIQIIYGLLLFKRYILLKTI